MSISISLADRYNNQLHLDKLLYAAYSNNNLAAVKCSTAMSPDSQSPPSIVQMLSLSSDGKFDNSKNPMTVLQGCGAIQPVQLCGNYSSMNVSCPSKSFKSSPISSISSCSLSHYDLEGEKTIHVAPQALGDETAVGDSKGETNNSEGTMVSKPRTQSSTGSTPKRRQTQTKTQTEAFKQKHQPATSKLKKSSAKAKSNNNRPKSRPPNRSLERNRISASKCRQKKKEWLSDLEANKSKLEKQYKSLNAEYNELLDEVTQLKNFLMAHAGCNDQNIDGWLNNEANSYIRRLKQNAGPQGAAALQAHQDTFRDTESLASPRPQASDSLLFLGNNGLLNEYSLDSMFDTDQCWPSQ